MLTPEGIAEKTKLTVNFMKRKMKEYDELKKIEREIVINVIFFNGDKGKYILNNIYKLKNINIKKIVVCRKKFNL